MFCCSWSKSWNIWCHWFCCIFNCNRLLLSTYMILNDSCFNLCCDCFGYNCSTFMSNNAAVNAHSVDL